MITAVMICRLILNLRTEQQNNEKLSTLHCAEGSAVPRRLPGLPMTRKLTRPETETTIESIELDPVERRYARDEFEAF